MKRLLMTLVLASLVFVCLATENPIHWITFTRTGPNTGTIRWSVDLTGGVDYIYLATHPATTPYGPPAYCDPNWNQPGGWAMSYPTDGPDIYYSNVAGLTDGIDYHAYLAAVKTGSGWSWTALSSWDSPPPPSAYDCPEGIEVPLYPDVDLTMLLGNANYAAGQPPTAPVNPSFSADHVQFFTLVGAGPWTMQFDTTLQWVWVVGQGVFAGPGIISVPIPASKDEDIEVQFGNGGNPTLPVELSSFSATLTAQNYVKLNWITQSETEMLGYRVYRGESSDQASSILITPCMIGATNTSTTQSYSVTDNEVAIGSTYWYWLESVDYASSNYHGPVSILVEGNVPPILPETTSLGNTYPNPFRMNSVTSLELEVKAGESGRVTIYNVIGQTVKTFSVGEGLHKLNWNGTDDQGRSCGSGVYFARLSTPSTTQVKKLLMIK